VVFHPLAREHMAEIAGIQFEVLKARLAEQDVSIELSPEAMNALVEEGYDPVYGARPLKRVIQKRIENPLAQHILAGDFPPGTTIAVGLEAEGSGAGSFTFQAA
jgi:ATP-dependent Clp protease ATP-binding subunit ClpB